MSYKFGALTEGDGVKHYYGNIYTHEVNPEWSRVVIGPNGDQIALMLDIAKEWEGPYRILYVLVIPLSDDDCARYQAPKPCYFTELERFAHTFREFFEGDGRHHLWFADSASDAQLVYDRHDIIYSYGKDEAVIALLEDRGFGDGELKIPDPHVHCYNEEFEEQADAIMRYFDWKKSPLQEGHDKH